MNALVRAAVGRDQRLIGASAFVAAHRALPTPRHDRARLVEMRGKILRAARCRRKRSNLPLTRDGRRRSTWRKDGPQLESGAKSDDQRDQHDNDRLALHLTANF